MNTLPFNLNRPLPSVDLVLTGMVGREPVDQMILVSAASIPLSIRREYGVNGWRMKYVSNSWTEAYAPADGCRYGCKVYVRKSGAVVRWAVLHSSTYGHPRPQATTS